MENIVDSVVVGAGVAGLSAALFLARAGLSTVVYDGGRPRIFAVGQVHEFLGFDGMAPSEMLERGRQEVVRYGAVVRNARVTRIEPRDDGLFNVWTADEMLTARTVVLATGLVDEIPQLHGVPEVWGEDLRICPCFDGHEVRDRRFVVFGLPERLGHMALWVSMWSRYVTVVTKADLGTIALERLQLRGIHVVNDEVTGLVHHNGALVAVSTESGVEIACDATWIAAGMRAASQLPAQLCDVDEAGFAKTDADGRTSRRGVFAIGNATDPIAHLAHAAASGTRVGPVVALYLLEAMLEETSLTIG